MREGKKLSAKKYLGQLEELDININQNLERLKEMKTDACSSSGIDYSKDRVQTSISGDKLGGQVLDGILNGVATAQSPQIEISL